MLTRFEWIISSHFITTLLKLIQGNYAFHKSAPHLKHRQQYADRALTRMVQWVHLLKLIHALSATVLGTCSRSNVRQSDNLMNHVVGIIACVSRIVFTTVRRSTVFKALIEWCGGDPRYGFDDCGSRRSNPCDTWRESSNHGYCAGKWLLCPILNVNVYSEKGSRKIVVLRISGTPRFDFEFIYFRLNNKSIHFSGVTHATGTSIS